MAAVPYQPKIESTHQRLKETEMLTHPDLVLQQAHQRQRELIAEADRHRLLALVRRNRRGNAAVSAAPRGRPAGARVAASTR
jgi:hypothetical protein